MLNIGQLVATVQQNCNISDARHAGNYSMCTFLMKMREYYRWEHELPYSCNLAKDEVGNWLVEREQTWEQLASSDYVALPMANSTADPFNMDAVNRELIPLGYVYSSGYGIFSKPHFFIGNLLNNEKRQDITILVSSCEHARDLVAPPAMLRNNTIIVRQESVRRFIWEKIEEWRWSKQKDNPMARAIACYGNGDTHIETLLDNMTQAEIDNMILHELGEIRAGGLLGPDWEKMVLALSATKAEFMVRALRDNLADCLCTLPELIQDNNEASLHFYFANFTGVRKLLFPQAWEAYLGWLNDNTLAPLQNLVDEAANRLLEQAKTVLRIYHANIMNSANAITQFLDPQAANQSAI